MSQNSDEKNSTETTRKAGPGLFGMLLLAACAGATSFASAMFLTAAPAPPATAEAANDTHESRADVTPLHDSSLVSVALPELLVTVGSSPATRYLKMNVAILAPPQAVSEVEAASPRLADAFNLYLRALEVKDFEDPQFYSRFREQLAYRAELVLGAEASRGVLITEFLLR